MVLSFNRIGSEGKSDPKFERSKVKHVSVPDSRPNFRKEDVVNDSIKVVFAGTQIAQPVPPKFGTKTAGTVNVN